MMHVNKMAFERNISLEYYHMTCIRVSMRLTVGRKTAENLAVGRKINQKKSPLSRLEKNVNRKKKLWECPRSRLRTNAS